MATNNGAVEKKRFPYFKAILGVIIVAAIVLIGIAVEKLIPKTVRDVNINKKELSAEKVTYFNVKPLGTRIMAVIAGDGTVRLAFEECLSCYYNDRGKVKFKDTGSSVVCEGCGCETTYDEMGLLSSDCTPYPILSDYRIEDDHTIMVQKDFLESCKTLLDDFRSKAENPHWIYPESEYMNMEISENDDLAVKYDEGGDPYVPESPVTTESLNNRAEDITKLYNGYESYVTLYSSAEDMAAFSELYGEFDDLCAEFMDSEVTSERAAEINRRFTAIEEGIRDIGGRAIEASGQEGE